MSVLTLTLDLCNALVSGGTFSGLQFSCRRRILFWFGVNIYDLIAVQRFEDIVLYDVLSRLFVFCCHCSSRGGNRT